MKLTSAHLSDYGRWLLERSEAYANWLLADQVEVGHLLGTLMETEECAACRAALQSFADPASIAEESRALSSGIMVTGSSASLPFSPAGLAALERSRELARAHASAAVEPAHLLAAAHSELPAQTREEFEAAGFDGPRLSGQFGRAHAWPEGAADSGSLFRRFSESSKRALSLAAREARTGGERSISAARILLGCLALEPELGGACGVSGARARALVRGRTADPSPTLRRDLPPDEALAQLVVELPLDAGSLAMLIGIHSPRTAELARLLTRARLTPAALQRLRGVLEDPRAPAGPEAVSPGPAQENPS
jgi:hypothetical protein